MKTRDNDAGTKIFINVVSSPHIEAGSGLCVQEFSATWCGLPVGGVTDTRLFKPKFLVGGGGGGPLLFWPQH